jgi:hypothetical protein
MVKKKSKLMAGPGAPISFDPHGYVQETAGRALGG